MKQSILIVENEHKLAKTLSNYFSSKGYHTKSTNTVNTAIELLENQSYDLVLLDRVLDDGDGIEILEFLNDYSFQTKVLVLSDLKSEEQRISGLESGADDYLPKPFSLVELNLRVKKLLLTHKLRKSEVLSLANLSVNPKTGEVHIKQQRIKLRKKELELLVCLLRYKNQVVSRDTMINSVWSNTYNIPTYSTLDVYIRRIRIALGKYKTYIQTVRGFGYMITQPG